MIAFKKLLLDTLEFSGFPASLKLIQRQCATIFMLHRFEDPENGIPGCDPENLRRGLEYLVRKKYRFISLSDLFDQMLKEDEPPCGAVAFTIDDGYADQARIAAPVFAEFDCPVTTFVSTGFLDKKVWFWWDQLEYIFEHTSKSALEFQLGDKLIHYQWKSATEKAAARSNLTEKCKLLTNEVKSSAIKHLAAFANVEIPKNAPRNCAPMTWEDLRSCEEIGMTFGPHTVNHPVLSRTSDQESHFEITESWKRLCEEARHPVPIFCYPNGQWSDFGEREIQTVAKLGLKGAVAGEPGYADSILFRNEFGNRFRVRRFGFPDTLPDLIQYVSGLERFKQIVRGEK